MSDKRNEEGVGTTAGLRFLWKGDLEDDCTCQVGNLLAHVERMGEISWKEVGGDCCHKSDWWFVTVERVDKNGRADGPGLFHTGEHAGMILGGAMARAIAEAIISGNTPHDLPR